MLTIVHQDYGIGFAGPIAISIWHGQLDTLHFPVIRKEWGSVRAKYPTGFGAITIVAEGAPMVANNARKPLADLYESFGSALKGASVVIEAPDLNGTAARLIRTIITAVRLVGRLPYPLETHDSLRSAVDWLSPKVGADNFAREVESVVTEYRAKRKT